MGFWMTLLIYAAMAVLSDLIAPKPEVEDAKPDGLGDFKLPTATEGRVLPRLWGTCLISGPNVVWAGDLRVKPIKEKIKTGIFTSKRVIRGYTYEIGLQFGLCKGVVDALEGFDIGESPVMSPSGIYTAAVGSAGLGYYNGEIVTLVGGSGSRPAKLRVRTSITGLVLAVEVTDIGAYDVFPNSPAATTDGSGVGLTITFEEGPVVTHEGTFYIDRETMFGGDDIGSGGASGTLQFFSGTNDQNVSSYLSQFQKTPALTGATSAYRDVCYVASADGPFYVGNSTSIKAWRFTARRTPNPLSLASNRHIVNGKDANPANVVYELLTDQEDGFGIDPDEVDVAALISVGTTLFNEGNGFSFLLDREEDAADTLRRVEDQVDGIVFQDPLTGLYTMRLVRNDYVLASTPILTLESNIVDVPSFIQETWEGTKNQVHLPFVNRNDGWKETYGFAQDMANILMVGKVTPTEVKHPGVKYGPLANALAWRELKTLARPLISAEVITDRSLYGVLPGDVVRLTLPSVNADETPMRVRSVNYGDLLNNRIRLKLVEDVFTQAPGVFANPPDTRDVGLEDELAAFAVDEQLAFEAPRALTLRDPGSEIATTDKIYAAARAQEGTEISFSIMQRNASGTPSGAYREAGEVFGFVFIGELSGSLGIGSAYPLTTLTVVASPDTQADLLSLFPTVEDLGELGTDLLTLCLIGEEFVLVQRAETSGADVNLRDVYRGALDSVQMVHAAGTPVYLLFVGGGISDTTVEAGNNVEVKLLPKNALDVVAIAEATSISFQMDNRTRRPYAPAEADLNGTRFDTTVTLEGGAGTGDAEGIDVEIVRRDFRTTNEIVSLLDDAGALDATFPAANNTTHEIDVIDDPAGTPTLLFTHAFGSGATSTVTRIDILLNNGGALPTSLRFAIRAVHDFEGASYDSMYTLDLDFSLSSALTGQFEFGALDTNIASAAFTVTNGAVDHNFELSSAFAAGTVQYRLNGGAWTSLITATNTTGTIANGLITNGDTIEIRHTSTDVGAKKFIQMDENLSAAAFGVLYV